MILKMRDIELDKCNVCMERNIIEITLIGFK